MTGHLDLDTLVLTVGHHDSPDDGMCVLEAVAYLAGEPFSDPAAPAAARVLTIISEEVTA